MGVMTSVPFAGGAIDLSALKPAPPAPAGTSYVVDTDDRTFEALVGRSMQHPVILEFWSPQANAAQLSADLASVVNEAGGKLLLARVNVDTAPAIASSLGIQAVPMVVAVLAGQLAPLFQGTADRATVKGAIDQVLQVAMANGLTGRVQPVPTVPTGEADATPDPRLAAADAALQAGDYPTAIAEFDKLLAANPADAEAVAGRAGARVLQRLETLDPRQVRTWLATEPRNADAQLAAADLELASGEPAAAFERLIAAVRDASGDDRERIRVRLLELFDAVGATDPAVLKARRALATALF